MGNLDFDEKKLKNAQFLLTENGEYLKAQSQQIRLGKEEGMDVSVYSNPEFDWLQMEQIRMGLKDKVDVSVYADPAYSYDTMKQIRLALYSEIDLMPYLERGFEDDSLEEIRTALLNRLPIDKWLKDEMCTPQINQIRIGLCEQLDVSRYADPKYNWMQMQEIRLGLEKKLDISVYSNVLFSHLQMREIRLGLESGLDVSLYDSLIYSATDMKEKRLALIDHKQAKTPVHGGKDSLLSMRMKSQFDISIEDNGNRAYAYIPKIVANLITKEDIYDELQRRNIVFGIKPDAIADLIDKKRSNKRILIAEGIPAAKGKDGWFEFFVRLDLPRIPAPLPDGGVDYVNIEAFEMVEKDERIAVYHPAGQGTDGKNIYGEIIHRSEEHTSELQSH